MKFLFPTPVVWDGNDARYLQRDGARFAEECVARGDEAVKVIYDDGKGLTPPKSPLLLKATREQWCDPAFWRAQKADLCLLYGGWAPSLEPVAAAIRKAGIPLLLKLDSSLGLLDFPQEEPSLFRRTYWLMREKHGVFRSLMLSAAYSAKRALRPSAAFRARYFSLFDALTAEGDVCRHNSERWAQKHGLSVPVLVLPHPVLNEFSYDASCASKKKQVLAVAVNWTNPLKRGKLLADALVRFLLEKPDATALVIGGHSEWVWDRAVHTHPELEARFQAKPAMPPDQLRPYYRESRIMAIPSGVESGPIVAFEAVCCGCSIVFGRELNHLQMFSEAGVGTMAKAWNSSRAFAEALLQEYDAWESGAHDPIQISRIWTPRLRVDSLTDRLYQWLEAHRASSVPGS